MFILVPTLRPGNLLYMMLIGWWLALIYLIIGCVMCLTIIGFPYGKCVCLISYTVTIALQYVCGEWPLYLQFAYPTVELINDTMTSLAIMWLFRFLMLALVAEWFYLHLLA